MPFIAPSSAQVQEQESPAHHLQLPDCSKVCALRVGFTLRLLQPWCVLLRRCVLLRFRLNQVPTRAAPRAYICTAALQLPGGLRAEVVVD